MANYKKYSTSKEQPSRMSRKRDRSTTFIKNKKSNRVAKALRKAFRAAALEELENFKIGGTD